MEIKINIPSPLRKSTGGLSEVKVRGATVGECINILNAQYPGIRERLCGDDGELRHFVNVYLNGEDVRFLQGLTTAVKAGDELSIVPAVAGG